MTVCLIVLISGISSGTSPVSAADSVVPAAARGLITTLINDTQRVIMKGNTRLEANAANDRGAVENTHPLDHMLLLLKRPAERDQALEQFMTEQQTLGSPNYHRWLTAEQFGSLYGPAQSDIDETTAWLKQKGFRINQVNAGRTMIDFSGTADLVKYAFGTEIHRLEVSGVAHIANMGDPTIPAALAPLVAGIVSLHDFRPHTNYKPRADYTFTTGSTSLHAMVPADLATIYGLTPLFNAGIKGQGQTIALIGDSDVHSTADIYTFRSTFGLGTAAFSQIHPGGCPDPGDIADDDSETTLDAEWAAAAAPAATLEVASCAGSSTSFGGLIAMQNLINAGSPPGLMSLSYGTCETENGATANAAYVATYQQAAAEGVSVFVSTGDEGAASCDSNNTQATHGIGVSGFASTPYNVAVGGTDFSDSDSGTVGNYWNNTNTATYGSAKSYIPEIPWNDSCAGRLIASFYGSSAPYGSSGFCNSSTGTLSYMTVTSGSGGPSGCASGTPAAAGVVGGSCAGTAKPAWQSGFVGNPSDGVRDIPDVSLFAANGIWGHYYLFCFSGSGGHACTGAPSGWSGGGGTSFSTPIMAGIQALVNQKIGSYTGNPNPIYYRLAAAEYGNAGSSGCNSSNGNTAAGNCIFYDVTKGDMDVNCTGTNSCYRPSGTNGVLSTSTLIYAPAYGTSTGWDFATGIGTVNAANLVNAWPAPDYSLSASPASLAENQGASSASTITVTPSNGFINAVSFTVSGLPAGVTSTFAGNVLTLTASSTAVPGNYVVTITGTSGNLSRTTSISLTVLTVNPPDYSLSASPGSLTEKQGASAQTTITVAALNGFTGSVALAASGLPSGVTASFSPASTSGTSTLTLTASTSAATGTSTITISGTSGALTHTASISLTVNMTLLNMLKGLL